MGVSQTAATTGSQSLLGQKPVGSPVTQQKTAQRAEPEVSSMLQGQMTVHQDLQMTELKEKSGQTSLATAREKPTAQSARAGQTVLPMAIETNLAVLTHAVLIPEASVSQPPVQTALGNQELLLLAPTLTVLGSHVLQDQTEATDLLTTEDHQTAASVQHVQTLTDQVLANHGNHVLQDQIDQSARQIPEALFLVQTHASMTGIEILTVKTESLETAQGMRAS